ncbi:hypothetical protein M0R45_026743 [Rubus argutus]|uniref:F-box domain-containing protein n=1 Tax=Rubus argutus TaxID=59490 RepID=A0AAW1X0W3_RUBAR
MMAKSIGSKKGDLLRLVEERSLIKKIEEEKKRQQEQLVPYLPKDCISSILVRLPIESLQRSSFVCKPWCSIIKSPKFIDAHLHRSESVLIFLSPITKERSYSFSMASVPEENPNTVSVEAKLLQPNWRTYSLESCYQEADCTSYWMSWGFVSCEILSLRKKAWREVDGPAFGLFGWFGYAPVSAIGALHWIPEFDRSDYIVSMEINEEKFHQIPLPKSCRTHDRIVAMGDALGFVIHEDINHIDVWILKGFCGEVWTKNHSITVGTIIDMTPLFSLRIKGDIIFKRDEDGSLYAYDFQHQEMTKVEMVKECIPKFSSTYLPHVNSLVSWMDASPDIHD